MNTTPPKIPTRTDATVACACGGVMSIAMVSPIPGKATHMRHDYACAACGASASFEVEKKKG